MTFITRMAGVIAAGLIATVGLSNTAGAQTTPATLTGVCEARPSDSRIDNDWRRKFGHSGQAPEFVATFTIK